MLGKSIAVVAVLSLALGACARQPDAASETKDVVIVDNGGNVVNADLLKCELFFSNGWIVYWGTQSNDGVQLPPNKRKLAKWDLEQRLLQSLGGSSAQASINWFMQQVVDDRHVVIVDVAQGTVKLPDGSILQNQTALAQVAVSAAKLLSTQGTVDQQQ